MRRENSSFKIADVLKLTKAAIQSVTARDWQKCIQHTIKLENFYWETDHIIEERVEPLIINITNSCESDSESEDDCIPLA